MSALYVSKDLTTAVAEYEQDLGCRPGTFCAYDIDVDGVVDLGDRLVLRQLGLVVADLRSPWKKIALIDDKRPPTWNLAKDLYETGFAGVLAPSVACPNQGTNLVLWRWNDSAKRRVRALDPNSDLPRDQSSWRYSDSKT